MELARLNLDTHKYVKLLQEKGFTEEQAEGVINTVQNIDLSGVATKQDIRDVRDEMQNLKDGVADVKARMATQRDIQSMMRFQLIQTVTIIGVMVALLAFFG